MKFTRRTIGKAAMLGLGSLSLGLGGCATELTDEDVREMEQLAGPWEGWLDQLNNANGFADSPSIFGLLPGAGIVARDAGTNRYRVLYHRSAPPLPWADLGTSTFVSKPASTSLDASFNVPVGQLNYQFAVFGRKSDNKFYISTWKADSTHPYTSASTSVIGWTVVGQRIFASAPATTLAGGSLYLVGRTANNVLYLRRNPLTGSLANPINNSNWSGEYQAPNLPAGWVAQGAPALANATLINNRVELFVRAVNNGQYRIFRARFNPSTNSWEANWSQIPTNGVTITTDPAAEYDTEEKITLYLKGNGRIYQASQINGVWQAFTPIGNNTFVGSPAALGNAASPGSHWAVAKKSNNQLQVVITQQGF